MVWVCGSRRAVMAPVGTYQATARRGTVAGSGHQGCLRDPPRRPCVPAGAARAWCALPQPGMQARRADPLLPVSSARGLSCCLCTNVWMTCAQQRRTCAYAVEMLGIPLRGRNQDKAFTWENASRILCIQINWNYPHTTSQ